MAIVELEDAKSEAKATVFGARRGLAVLWRRWRAQHACRRTTRDCTRNSSTARSEETSSWVQCEHGSVWLSSADRNGRAAPVGDCCERKECCADAKAWWAANRKELEAAEPAWEELAGWKPTVTRGARWSLRRWRVSTQHSAAQSSRANIAKAAVAEAAGEAHDQSTAGMRPDLVSSERGEETAEGQLVEDTPSRCGQEDTELGTAAQPARADAAAWQGPSTAPSDPQSKTSNRAGGRVPGVEPPSSPLVGVGAAAVSLGVGEPTPSPRSGGEGQAWVPARAGTGLIGGGVGPASAGSPVPLNIHAVLQVPTLRHQQPLNAATSLTGSSQVAQHTEAHPLGGHREQADHNRSTPEASRLIATSTPIANSAGQVPVEDGQSQGEVPEKGRRKNRKGSWRRRQMARRWKGVVTRWRRQHAPYRGTLRHVPLLLRLAASGWGWLMGRYLQQRRRALGMLLLQLTKQAGQQKLAAPGGRTRTPPSTQSLPRPRLGHKQRATEHPKEVPSLPADHGGHGPPGSAPVTSLPRPREPVRVLGRQGAPEGGSSGHLYLQCRWQRVGATVAQYQKRGQEVQAWRTAATWHQIASRQEHRWERIGGKVAQIHLQCRWRRVGATVVQFLRRKSVIPKVGTSGGGGEIPLSAGKCSGLIGSSEGREGEDGSPLAPVTSWYQQWERIGAAVAMTEAGGSVREALQTMAKEHQVRRRWRGVGATLKAKTVLAQLQHRPSREEEISDRWRRLGRDQTQLENCTAEERILHQQLVKVQRGLRAGDTGEALAKEMWHARHLATHLPEEAWHFEETSVARAVTDLEDVRAVMEKVNWRTPTVSELQQQPSKAQATQEWSERKRLKKCHVRGRGGGMLHMLMAIRELGEHYARRVRQDPMATVLPSQCVRGTCAELAEACEALREGQARALVDELGDSLYGVYAYGVAEARQRHQPEEEWRRLWHCWWLQQQGTALAAPTTMERENGARAKERQAQHAHQRGAEEGAESTTEQRLEPSTGEEVYWECVGGPNSVQEMRAQRREERRQKKLRGRNVEQRHCRSQQRCPSGTVRRALGDARGEGRRRNDGEHFSWPGQWRCRAWETGGGASPRPWQSRCTRRRYGTAPGRIASSAADGGSWGRQWRSRVGKQSC